MKQINEIRIERGEKKEESKGEDSTGTRIFSVRRRKMGLPPPMTELVRGASGKPKETRALPGKVILGASVDAPPRFGIEAAGLVHHVTYQYLRHHVDVHDSVTY